MDFPFKMVSREFSSFFTYSISIIFSLEKHWKKQSLKVCPCYAIFTERFYFFEQTVLIYSHNHNSYLFIYDIFCCYSYAYF